MNLPIQFFDLLWCFSTGYMTMVQVTQEALGRHVTLGWSVERCFGCATRMTGPSCPALVLPGSAAVGILRHRNGFYILGLIKGEGF